MSKSSEAKITTWAQKLSVACPKCGAPAERACRGRADRSWPQGTRPLLSTHHERRMAYLESVAPSVLK